MLAFGGLNSGIFKALLVLHILSAIFGFGGVVLNGLYAAQSQQRPGPTGDDAGARRFSQRPASRQEHNHAQPTQ